VLVSVAIVTLSGIASSRTNVYLERTYSWLFRWETTVDLNQQMLVELIDIYNFTISDCITLVVLAMILWCIFTGIAAIFAIWVTYETFRRLPEHIARVRAALAEDSFAGPFTQSSAQASTDHTPSETEQTFGNFVMFPPVDRTEFLAPLYRRAKDE
jgi:hypothetical protein